MDKQVFTNYRKRVVREAVLKSSLAGIAIGAVCAAVFELASWFFGFKAGLYIAIGLLVAVSVGASLILYYKKYKPTTKAIARRVDELGLEERVLTMVEFQGEDSYIANAQRNDTMHALGSVNHMMIKFAVTVALIITICVSCVALAGMTTVNALYIGDVIPSGLELIRGEEFVREYSVRYTYTVGGKIVLYKDGALALDEYGEYENGAEIIVKEGENAPRVVAVPEFGFVFVGWSDNNSRSPSRFDKNVAGNIKATAQFAPLSDLDLYAPGGPEFGMSLHLPSDKDDDNNDRLDKFTDDKDSPQREVNEDEEGSGSDKDDRLLSSNQTDDGNHYYGDTYEDDYGSALGGEYSEEHKKVVDSYFSGIEPPGSSDGEDGDNGGTSIGGLEVNMC